jgi:hypothetical protein
VPRPVGVASVAGLKGFALLTRCRIVASVVEDDLGRFVEAMRRDQRPHLVVPTNAVRAWQAREPQTWAMVCEWLAEQGKSVVQVLERRLVVTRDPPLTSPSAHAGPWCRGDTLVEKY